MTLFILICIGIVLIAAAHTGDQKKTTYDADFMPVGEHLSVFNKGFCLNGKHCETIQDSLKNAIVFGSTGNFKSASVIIPCILKMYKHASLIIHDPSHELRIKCAAILKEKQVEVKTVNWAKPEFSEGYNPLQRIQNVSDIQKISKLLIVSSLGEESKDPFWNIASESLITFCIRYITVFTSKEHHNLFNVYHFLSSLLHSPEKIDRLIINTKDRKLIGEYKSFLSYGSKTLASIVATCRTALSIFGTDPTVALITSHDTLEFSDCRKQRTAIFINTSIQDQKYYSVLTSIFLQQFFAELMRKLPTKGELPVFFLCEEASSIRFNSLQITLANCRKHFCSILQVYQSKSQLVDLYGQAVARAILDNSYATVYMGGQSIQVSQELEATLGKFEYVDEKGARQIRSLLTASEIHELEENIILLGNRRAIKTKPVPYFKQQHLLKQTELPPYQPKGKIPHSSPILFEIYQ